MMQSHYLTKTSRLFRVKKFHAVHFSLVYMCCLHLLRLFCMQKNHIAQFHFKFISFKHVCLTIPSLVLCEKQSRNANFLFSSQCIFLAFISFILCEKNHIVHFHLILKTKVSFNFWNKELFLMSSWWVFLAISSFVLFAEISHSVIFIYSLWKTLTAFSF